jgi:hypothetical protein
MSNRKPKWGKWNLIDDARVWQIVALSLDIDPDAVTRSSNDWMAGGSFVNHEGDDFRDRLDVIIANYNKIDPTPKKLSMNGIAYGELNIPKFAKWAIENNLLIPDELKLRAEGLESNSPAGFDAKKYRAMPLWSEAELQAMLCGLSPDGARPSNAELNYASEQLRRAVLAKELSFISPSDATAGDKFYAHDRFFKPDDSIAWAGDRFSKFPFKGEQVSNSEKPLFDETDTKYPIELDMAIKAWQVASKSNGKGKPKVRIRAWLDENTSLSNEAKERISIVSNWDKLGGATRTG